MGRIHLTRIIIITVVWTFLGVFLTLYDELLLESHLSSGYNANYDFWDALRFNVLSGFFGGLMGATAFRYIYPRFRERPFYVGLAAVVVTFFLIVSTITLFSAVIPVLASYAHPLANPNAKAFFLEQILTTMHLKNLIFWAIVVAITHFSIQVSDKFGPGNLWKILTGRYHFPKHENRVFMFLDLKSSTAIAEKLGGEKYHQFLKDVFSDITNPILESHAEIYQYVGDEVVVSWSMDKVKDKTDYLNCFFRVTEALKKNDQRYKERYGLSPEFKAGAHYGDVVAGEVGIIKKDITYSGDVLNTTARIQSQCNLLGVRLLISHDLREHIGKLNVDWSLQSQGEISLRGKKRNLELISVKQVVPVA